jgi:hypothetical protein
VRLLFGHECKPTEDPVTGQGDQKERPGDPDIALPCPDRMSVHDVPLLTTRWLLLGRITAVGQIFKATDLLHRSGGADRTARSARCFGQVRLFSLEGTEVFLENEIRRPNDYMLHFVARALPLKD